MNPVVSNLAAGETVMVRTENAGSILLSVQEAGGEVFVDVTDDDGIVGANAVVTHIVMAPGVLATDKVKSVSIPDAAIGSGIVVLAAVHAAGQLSISYINGTGAGATNGSTTYRVYLQR